MANNITTTAPVTSEVSVNAYITIDEANTYVNTHFIERSSWTNATDTDKAIVLNDATIRIDRLPFKGSRTVVTQDFEFPRGGDTSPPSAIDSACAEIAFALIDGKDPDYEYESLRVSKDKVSGVEITSDTGVFMTHKVAGIPSLSAWNLLIPYLRDNSSFSVSRA